ncbi:type II toxin-antitoxin system Phd/YefM family antitoxin [Candidatus Gribaldobacteria bacterium]|nr:type II toxin-antitoxin system Phd/YefM family antitoxin [Candidatus Gribaldobacteria bacterium]
MNQNFEKIIPATQARKNFFTILKKLQAPGYYYTVTLDGRPCAVVLSFSEFNAWRETIAIENDKELADDLKQFKNYQFKASDFVPLEDVLKKQGFLVAESPKKEYVSRRIKKKSGKRTK